ncbi:hypothetical protein ABMA32_18520 [Mesorhizobium sp. VNQ89]|uniref:hypothetical protein n=1 Tax=Mesorhizobium quangtriensis TaxID=3157709 RepID=UPI0032B7D280
MKRLVLILLSACAVAPALAEDLPGVTRPKPIVQPVPEPDEQQAETAKDAIRVGEWDVKLSGSVSVDVGVGSARKPQR